MSRLTTYVKSLEAPLPLTLHTNDYCQSGFIGSQPKFWPSRAFTFFYVGPPITLRVIDQKQKKLSLVFRVEARRPRRPGAPRISS